MEIQHLVQIAKDHEDDFAMFMLDIFFICRFWRSPKLKTFTIWLCYEPNYGVENEGMIIEYNDDTYYEEKEGNISN